MSTIQGVCFTGLFSTFYAAQSYPKWSVADENQVRCGHSRCTLRCHEACAPCVEDCTWSCDHKGKCSMPCAAPCGRLPCNHRCSRTLSCGHQCPGLCGETCPENLCHTCSDCQEARVDLLEMKTYSQIDPNETPIISLGCGHFFTAETLDGHMGMTDVYIQDQSGEFTGLRGVSAELARSIPRCPDCQCPVRQHCTQRYNRIINRAVIDEMSKRFLVNGKEELRRLELEILKLEQEFEESRGDVIKSIRQTVAHYKGRVSPAMPLELFRTLKERKIKGEKLEKSVSFFCHTAADKNQPAQKLSDAMINAARRRNIDQSMANLSITNSVPVISRDRRITFGGHMAQVQGKSIVIGDSLSIAQIIISSGATSFLEIPKYAPEQLVSPFFKTCRTLIEDCGTEHLPKLEVEATIYYAKIAYSYQSYCYSTKADMKQASEYMKTAKELLPKAKTLCNQPFKNADILSKAIDDTIRLLNKESYAPITADELTAIKTAMLTSSQGMATHSGHWYNCQNGHPVSLYSSLAFTPIFTSLPLPSIYTVSLSFMKLTVYNSSRSANAACPWN